MNKSELVAAVAQETGLTKADTQSTVEALLKCITSALQKGDDVRIIGFGTFSVTERAASKGRNPRTGEEIDIPASKNAKFKAGKELKEAVNQDD